MELNILLRARSASAIGTVEKRLAYRWVSVAELEGVEVLPETLKQVALTANHSVVTAILDGLDTDLPF
ncbi:hypothetical protein GOEFS_064_00270 [Gordonia effusa NBRC 100432]|uniref:Uncharacterized protein n=1 Tax=Gordonia effusa NBRC 100432 TaxID=1077974 RepID=H0R137_9ACTN|nr:hypothetical protein GOEFS_064_00270 [Gordonia effusa NBRC 100432]